MKLKPILIALFGSMTLAFVACDTDGNTGNGANDPTDRFESDKVKKAGNYGNNAINIDSTSTDSLPKPNSTATPTP